MTSTATARGLVRLSRPAMRWTLRRTIGGRRIDPDDPRRGRFLRSDVSRVAARCLDEAEPLWPLAELERLPTVGARVNVALTVVTLALYRALLAHGVPEAHARGLVADSGWHLYGLSGRWLRRVSAIRRRDRYGQMASVLRMLLRFPFAAPGRPGYEVEARDDGDAFLTTWTWCPPQAFARKVSEAHGGGDLEAFRSSWCAFDYAFNDVIAGGSGAYRRPHTLSYGDDRCDMTWAIAAKTRSIAP